jgi:phosphohistidine phosphatase
MVRHAEAAPGEPDDLRELTPKGFDQARALGMELAADGIRPDVVLSSPLLRARQTAQEIARATGSSVEPSERLAPGASPDDVRSAVAGRGERVVVVGHQPDCGVVIAALTGREVAFPPAGIAAADLPS